MANCFRSTISTLLVCLVLLATAAYFHNTEAFLNGRHHFDQSRHHDYDQNGKKESTHHKHGSPLVVMNLVFVLPSSSLIISQSSFSYEASPVYDLGQLTLEEYKSAIFRPPILS